MGSILGSPDLGNYHILGNASHWGGGCGFNVGGMVARCEHAQAQNPKIREAIQTLNTKKETLKREGWRIHSPLYIPKIYNGNWGNLGCVRGVLKLEGCFELLTAEIIIVPSAYLDPIPYPLARIPNFCLVSSICKIRYPQERGRS